MEEKKYQNVSFGSIKEPRVTQADPFEGKPVLTLDIAPTVRGASSRVLLNKAGEELLGVTDNKEYPVTTLFGRNDDGTYDVFLLTIEGVVFDSKTLYLLRKNKTISSKTLYHELRDVFKIKDVTKENYFELTEDTEIVEYVNNNIIREIGDEGKVLKAVRVKLYTEEPLVTAETAIAEEVVVEDKKEE